MNNCSIEKDISDNVYELLYFIIETINQSVSLYFLFFFNIFYKSVSVIETSVQGYFRIFENIFIACIQTPQIYFMTIIVFMVLLTFYLVFSKICSITIKV